MTAVMPKKKAGRTRVEPFTLTATQATNKEVFLANTPADASTVLLDLPNGTVQRLGADYEVDGNRVYWDGFSLETVLEENDNIIISYS